MWSLRVRFLPSVCPCLELAHFWTHDELDEFFRHNVQHAVPSTVPVRSPRAPRCPTSVSTTSILRDSDDSVVRFTRVRSRQLCTQMMRTLINEQRNCFRRFCPSTLLDARRVSVTVCMFSGLMGTLSRLSQ